MEAVFDSSIIKGAEDFSVGMSSIALIG
jgi:hypothetical protein